MRILFLSRWFPYPANNGSKLRIYNLLRGLGHDHSVDLISFFDPTEGAIDSTGLAPYCKKIVSIPWKEYKPSSLRAIRGFFYPEPRSVVDTYSAEMEQAIQGAESENYDLVIVSQIDMAIYRKLIRKIPALLEEVEIGVLHQNYNQSPFGLKRLRHGLTWFKHRIYLRRLLRDFSACTVVSEKEAELVRQIAPACKKLTVIPNGIDLEEALKIQRDPQPATMIYTGSFRYYANYEAMLWFVSEVFPLVRRVVPEATLTITGDSGGKILPTVKGVILTGYVPDVRPLVAGSWLSLAPLRNGGGTRLKVLEAFALRTPVVATVKGAEGLAVKNGQHILIADDPSEFAAQVVSLFRDPALRERLTTAALSLVENKYAWPVVLPRFQQLVDDISSKSTI